MSDYVVLDTNVFSMLRTVEVTKALRKLPQERDYLEPLIGKEFAISFQTATEILQGAYAAQCGEARLGALHRIIDSTLVIPANEKVIEAAAKLYAEARAAGHALQDKAHTADRWIAASAFAYDLPLVSTDKIFVDAPGLKLLTV